MAINKQYLSKLEIECANNLFKDSELEYFRKIYRSSRDIVNNLKPVHIIIPVADRNDFLRNLLDSIKWELLAFGFPAWLISVSIVNDSNTPIADDIVSNYTYDIKVRNIPDQISFIKENYPKEKLQKIYWKFLKALPENDWDWAKKWSWSTMNTARLLVNKTVDIENSILWFIDSDEEFSIMTLTDTWFKVIPHAFSAFDAIQETFNIHDADIVTWKITWDPAFSAPQMIRTQLTDILSKTTLRLDVSEYYHQNRAYNDLPLFSQEHLSDAYRKGFPILPFTDRWTTQYHPLHLILMWHHISRPICYSNPLDVLKTWSVDRWVYVWDIIRPWNVAWNKKIIQFPTPFVESKVRLHWPILGKLLSKMWQKIHTANIPLLHRRVFDIEEITSWFRWWTEEIENRIDISQLRVKQISWDVVMQYITRCNHYNWIDDAIFENSYSFVMSAYEQQIVDIRRLIDDADVSLTNDEVMYLINSLRYSLWKLEIEKDSIKNSLKESLQYLASFDWDLKNRQELLES